MRQKFIDAAVWPARQTFAHILHFMYAKASCPLKFEGEIRGKPPDVRCATRQGRSCPLLDAMYSWLNESLSKLSPKSDTTKAIRYMLERWPALIRYTEDGRIEIDNNIAEQALRTIAFGRKNWLHCGSDAGGDRTAAI